MMADEKVPEKMQPIYEEIIAITDNVCQQYLNQEYADLSRRMAGKLCRKRPSPLVNGRAKTWAAGIVYALGQINFLFDKSQSPYIAARDLCTLFDVSQNSVSARAKQIRDILKINIFDYEWMLSNLIDESPLTWLVTVNGLIVDVRDMPRIVQEEAYRKGLIPYVPVDKET